VELDRVTRIGITATYQMLGPDTRNALGTDSRADEILAQVFPVFFEGDVLPGNGSRQRFIGSRTQPEGSPA
jgi:hypothetical protein